MEEATEHMETDGTEAPLSPAESQTPKKEEHKLEGVAAIGYNFTTNQEALSDFVNTLSPIAKQQDETGIGRITEGITSVLTELGYSESQLKARKDEKLGKPENPPLISKEDAGHRLLTIARALIPLTVPKQMTLFRSAFVMLNSNFDQLIADLISYFYKEFPDALHSDNSLTLSELQSCSDIDEAREFVTAKTVRTVTSGSLDQQMRFFRQTIKVTGFDEVVKWDVVSEAVARRNLLVHCGGIVNRSYLSEVPLEERPPDAKTAKIGSILVVPPQYFRDAFTEFFAAGMAVLQCCWRKWHKDERDEADGVLIDIMYRTLLKEDWKLAERIGELAASCKAADEENRLLLLFNYCISLKQLDRFDLLDKCIANLDVSAHRPKFRLAVAALRNDERNIYRTGYALDSGKSGVMMRCDRGLSEASHGV